MLVCRYLSVNAVFVMLRGNGGIDYDSAQSWLDLLNDRGVSFLAWSLSNKNETSALIHRAVVKPAAGQKMIYRKPEVV